MSLSDAACRGLDPNVFYPDEDLEDYEEKVAVAKSICASCPARLPCLDLGKSEEYGIWGGKTERERHLST